VTENHGVAGSIPALGTSPVWEFGTVRNSLTTRRIKTSIVAVIHEASGKSRQLLLENAAY
jgi:hypothetical protein